MSGGESPAAGYGGPTSSASLYFGNLRPERERRVGVKELLSTTVLFHLTLLHTYPLMFDTSPAWAQKIGKLVRRSWQGNEGGTACVAALRAPSECSCMCVLQGAA